MSKLMSVLVLGVCASSLAHAAPTCADFDVAGTWKNYWGNKFEIQQPSCDQIVVHDVDHNLTYAISLDGRHSSRFDGKRLENVPSLNEGKEVNHQWTVTSKPLLVDFSASGKLGPNPWGKSDYYQNSPKAALMTLEGKVLLPRPGSHDRFYEVRAAVDATVSASHSQSSYDCADSLWINFKRPRVVALGGTPVAELNPFARGFIKGLNALLSLYEFNGDSADHDGVFHYLDGANVFREFVDWKSRSLCRATE